MQDIFVSPEWVEDHLSEISVVDVRREEEIGERYLPQAVHIPFNRFRDPGDKIVGKLPTPSDFATLLGEAGIAPGDRIVAYDNDCGVYASRFLVTAEVFGHDIDRLHLLNGDIERWAQDHETVSTVSTKETADYTCPKSTGRPLISAAELEEELSEDVVIVDTRDALEFRTVHLPGAVNLRWRDLVNEEMRQLKSRDHLKQILEDHGIQPNRPVRLYCNTARRLCFVYAALRDLGYEDVAFYEGGIDAWATYGGPVETTIS